MFIGHGLLAFALVAFAGPGLGWSRERTLSLAVLAFAFGTLPDIDIVYAPVGLLGGASGVFAASEAFWQTGNIVHRAMTHSLLVGVVASLAFGLWLAPRGWQSNGVRGAVALALLGSLVAGATLATGGLGGVIMTVFVLGGLAITTVAGWRGLTPAEIAGMALVGLLTHPFGDLVTGSPPALLYPLDIPLITERIVLHPDPTLHLVGAFVIELATFWLAGLAYCRLTDRRVRDYVSPRATAGLGYAGAAMLLPAPTLEASSQFVFSILAVGIVGTVGIRVSLLRRSFGRELLRWPTRPRLFRPVTLADRLTTALTGLAAVTLAVTAYTLAYLFV